MRSFDAVKLVLDHAPKDLTPIQRLVLIQIAHRQPNCYPSIDQLAADIGIRQSATITKATKELEARDLIIIKRRKKKTNIYELNVLTLRGIIPMSNKDIGETIPMFDDVLNHGETSIFTPHATPVKQTSNKQDNKEAFERFWEVYPRHDSKSKAEQVFAEALLKVASEEVLITASRTFREVMRDTPVKFVPLASTWLRDERWLDEVTVGDDWDLDVYR